MIYNVTETRSNGFITEGFVQENPGMMRQTTAVEFLETAAACDHFQYVCVVAMRLDIGVSLGNKSVQRECACG